MGGVGGYDVYGYLLHLLTVLPERYAADPQASIDDLMPWAEEIQKKF